MSSPDLTTLEHEVAELRRRFKHERPTTDVDPERQTLLERTRSLNEQQQALIKRRDTLESELRRARGGDVNRRVVFTALGGLSGVALALLGGSLTIEAIALATVELSPLAGVLLLVAIAPAPLLLRLR
ncbi:MAG: hypothetical protein ABTQ32_08160 [Myxococcaceae bacterium]